MQIQKLVPTFYAEDLKPVLAFYRTLGFVADTIWPDESAPEILILDHGPVSLMYALVGPMPRSSGQINLEVDDVDAVLQQLPPDWQIEWGPEDFDYGRREFGLRDPNGVMVVFSSPL